MEQIHAAITYYIREGFWNTIKTICDQVSTSSQNYELNIFTGDEKRS